MKICAIFLFACLIATQAAPIGETSDIVTLFETANEFQKKLSETQVEVDDDLTDFRLSVSSVLRTSSSKALSEVEMNALAILELEAPVKQAVNTLPAGECSTNLRTLLDSVTAQTGFASSNCVSTFDVRVDAQVTQAQDMISVYDGVFTELQQLVVKAFVGKNKFTEPDRIIEKFQGEFATRIEVWEEMKPNVDAFVTGLTGTITGYNSAMNGCMGDVQTSVSSAYTMIQTRIQACIDFENTPNPLRVALKPLTLEDVFPKGFLLNEKL